MKVLTVRNHLSQMPSVLSGAALVLLHLQASSLVGKGCLKEMRQSPLHRVSGRKVEGAVQWDLGAISATALACKAGQ